MNKYYWAFWRPITAIHEAFATTTRDGHRCRLAALFIPTLDPAIAGAEPPLITPPYSDFHPQCVFQPQSGEPRAKRRSSRLAKQPVEGSSD